MIVVTIFFSIILLCVIVIHSVMQYLSTFVFMGLVTIVIMIVAGQLEWIVLLMITLFVIFIELYAIFPLTFNGMINEKKR